MLRVINTTICLLFLVALPAAGRAQGGAPCPPTAGAVVEVVGGRPAPEETSTVWIEAANAGPSNYLCSGTLVGTNRVLTAAHCICPDCRMVVGFGPNRNSTNAGDKITTNVLDFVFHPSYRRSGPAVQPGHDLAVLVLENYASCPAYKAAAPIYAIAPVVGSATKGFGIVGYGLSEAGLGAVGQKKRAEVVASSVTCTQPWARRAGCVAFAEFVLEGSTRPVANSSLGADTCSGDSGGPAFMAGENGTRLLAGVTSRGVVARGGIGDRGCGFGGIYGFAGIPDTLTWLRSVVPDLKTVEK